MNGWYYVQVIITKHFDMPRPNISIPTRHFVLKTPPTNELNESAIDIEVHLVGIPINSISTCRASNPLPSENRSWFGIIRTARRQGVSQPSLLPSSCRMMLSDPAHIFSEASA
jgi:hypothetical protein